jgi:4'-phosphopantetheinyl transferase
LTDIKHRQAHVWTLPVSPADDVVIERLRPVLSKQEAARSEQIKDQGKRREYLAAHILTHQMLAHFSTVAAADWHFVSAPHGRPEPAPDVSAGGLRFNLSHTTGMVACALSKDDAIGVDVEWMERSNNLQAIAGKKFAASEAACFNNAPQQDRQQIFFSFWTLKESYIKAIGKGLAEPLDGFALQLEPPTISFLNGQDNAECWGFDLFQPSPVHLAALCLARAPGAALDISRRHLGWDDVLTL